MKRARERISTRFNVLSSRTYCPEIARSGFVSIGFVRENGDRLAAV
jgi:hypothetical protein